VRRTITIPGSVGSRSASAVGQDRLARRESDPGGRAGGVERGVPALLWRSLADPDRVRIDRLSPAVRRPATLDPDLQSDLFMICS